MRSKAVEAVAAALVALALAAGPVAATNNPNGIVFRGIGFFRGKSSVSSGTITCEIPNTSSAISDGFFDIGLWNTFGIPNIYFPDPNHPFADPCGGWLQLQNNLSTQSIQLEQVNLTFKVAGAKRFRQFVPTRNGFPIACRQFRKATLFIGGLINPVTGPPTSQSGASNTIFVQLLPMVSTQLFTCLRSQYAGIPTDVYSSLPLVIHAQAVGVSDVGDTYRANTVAYTLNLRHTCGNGRVDDGEQCDPTAVGNTCQDTCDSNHCSISGAACVSDGDCFGSCLPQNDPGECSCVF
jgi:hypothetical protein